MTDKQIAALLVSARADLKKTVEGYQTHPNGTWWAKAMPKLDRAIKALTPPPVPALGPVKPNGLAVLLHSLTHNTDGFEGIWPAFDDTSVSVGTPVVAPEACTVIDHTGSDGGVGFKVRGASKIVHLFLHCSTRPPVGAKFAKGAKLSTVARIRQDQGGPHIHYAIDTRPLVGVWLKYGRNGNGPDYTYGSPTVGAQLAALLAAV